MSGRATAIFVGARDIISGYTGMMLTVDCWLLTVDCEQWTRIYYSDANGFDMSQQYLPIIDHLKNPPRPGYYG